MLRIVFLSSFLFFIVLGCDSSGVPALPYYNTPDFSPIFIDNPKTVETEITHRIGTFVMNNQHGVPISEKTIDDKIHIANFMFTSCGSICPKMTNNLKAIEAAFMDDKDVVLLSFSVTPWMDSIPVLKRFAESYDISSPNWHLLTGTTNAIYSLARTSYFAEEELGFTKDSTDFLHTERVLLVDQSRRIRGVYNATLRLEIEQLKQDIIALKQEDNF